MDNRGIAFHVHHGAELVEVCWSVAERLGFIRADKPAKEIPLRNHLLQIIPEERLSTELAAALAEIYRLRDESDRLRAESDRLWDESYRQRAESKRLRDESERLWDESKRQWAEGKRQRDESDRLWDEGKRQWAEGKSLRAETKRLRDESDRLWAESDRLRAETISTHMPELLVLHAELCIDCPWDGKTIFTRKNAAGEWY